MLASIGFTASRNIAGFEDRIGRLLDELPSAEEYITGACIGGDAFIGKWMYDKFPEKYHTIYVPWDKSRIDIWWGHAALASEYLDDSYGGLAIWSMHAGTTYRDRNQKIVDNSELLVAFPEYPEQHPKSTRSGSWQTIRMAKKLNVPIQIHVLKS